MTTLERLRIARGAERRLGGATSLENGETWYQRVNRLIDQAVAEGHSDKSILDAMQVTVHKEATNHAMGHTQRDSANPRTG